MSRTTCAVTRSDSGASIGRRMTRRGVLCLTSTRNNNHNTTQEQHSVLLLCHKHKGPQAFSPMICHCHSGTLNAALVSDG